MDSCMMHHLHETRSEFGGEDGWRIPCFFPPSPARAGWADKPACDPMANLWTWLLMNQMSLFETQGQWSHLLMMSQRERSIIMESGVDTVIHHHACYNLSRAAIPTSTYFGGCMLCTCVIRKWSWYGSHQSCIKIFTSMWVIWCFMG